MEETFNIGRPNQISYEQSGCLIMMSEVENTEPKQLAINESPASGKRKSSPFNFKFTRKSDVGSNKSV